MVPVYLDTVSSCLVSLDVSIESSSQIKSFQPGFSRPGLQLYEQNTVGRRERERERKRKGKEE